MTRDEFDVEVYISEALEGKTPQEQVSLLKSTINECERLLQMAEYEAEQEEDSDNEDDNQDEDEESEVTNG